MSITISLQQVEEAIERAERSAEEAQRRLDALRKIADGLRDLNGHAADVLGGAAVEPVFLPAEKIQHPRGRDAVRAIVSERQGLWSLGAIRDEMKQRGWFTSNKAVEVAVTRLCASGEAARTSEKGVYRFPAHEPVEEVKRESYPSSAAMIAA